MSLFDEANADAYTLAPEAASEGPRLGFQQAFEASFDLQSKVQSMFGLEQSFRAVEQAQMKKMRDAGLQPHQGLDDSDVGAPSIGGELKVGRYTAIARKLVDNEDAGYVDDMVKDRDAHILRERELHPELGLQTYEEMYKGVQSEAQRVVKQSALPTSFGGAVGGFLGSTLGSMDPLTNPLNFMTLPVTAGEGVLARMGVQAGAQGGAEAGSDIFGKAENQRLLTGVEPTTSDRIKGVLYAAAGGAAVEGLGAAAAAGGRRILKGKWFDDLPTDKGPPPRDVPPTRPMDPETTGHAELMEPGRPIGDYPDLDTFTRAHGFEPPTPYGATREATLRHATDLDYVAGQLDRWDGPAPWEIPARTDTALPVAPEQGVRYDQPYQKYIDNLDTPADIARRLDPDLFRTYDQLDAQIKDIRATIDKEKATQTFLDADEEARQRRELDSRQEIQRLDQKMRDLAPLVSRAMGAAEHEWRHTPLDTNTLTFLKNLENNGSSFRYRGEGEPSLTEKPMRPKPPDAPLPVVSTLGERVPQSVLAPDRQAQIRPGNDAADRVVINATEDMKLVDDKVEAFTKNARKISSLDADELKAQEKAARDALEAAAGPEARAKAQKALDEATGITLPNGARMEFNEKLPGPDGKEITVRDYLAEMDRNQQALDAVTTCSRPS